MLPSAYMISSGLVPQVNSSLLLSVEATSTSPLTIQYVINPAAVWSDGVPVTADDFIYAWQSQDGDGVDVDGQPDQVASTLGLPGHRLRHLQPQREDGDGGVLHAVHRLAGACSHDMVPAHIARRVGWNHGFDHFNPAVDLSAGP